MAPAKARKAVEIFNEQFRRDELTRRAALGADELSRTELSKLCATRWKELSEEEKSRYVKQAEKEKPVKVVESESEEEDEPAPKPKSSKTKAKAASVDRDSQGKENKKKAKKDKDPNAPKRATTSFFVFGAQMRPVVKNENPDMKPTDVAKELGRLWKELSDPEKAPYEAIAKEDKKRYQREMEDYKNA